MLRIINKQGLFLRDDFTFDELTEIGLDVIPAQGLYLPTWDFEQEKWIEGGVAPEPVAQLPTLEERVATVEDDTDAIIDIIALEMGVTL